MAGVPRCSLRDVSPTIFGPPLPVSALTLGVLRCVCLSLLGAHGIPAAYSTPAGSPSNPGVSTKSNTFQTGPRRLSMTHLRSTLLRTVVRTRQRALPFPGQSRRRSVLCFFWFQKFFDSQPLPPQLAAGVQGQQTFVHSDWLYNLTLVL